MSFLDSEHQVYTVFDCRSDDQRRVPALAFGGAWLIAYGFLPDTDYEIIAAPGYLILRRLDAPPPSP